MFELEAVLHHWRKYWSIHITQGGVPPNHPEQFVPKYNYRGCKYICFNGWYYTYNYKQSIYVMHLWTNTAIKSLEVLDSRGCFLVLSELHPCWYSQWWKGRYLHELHCESIGQVPLSSPHIPIIVFLLLLFLLLLLFCFLGPQPWHMEVPRLGVKSELQLPAYSTATATQDPSPICDLRHSSWQHWIQNPQTGTRDQTHIFMDTSQICFCCATMGTPKGHLNFNSFNSWA